METVTVSEFCKSHEITAEFKHMGRGTQSPWDEKWECDHWKVKFTRRALSGSKPVFMTVDFYCGSGLSGKQPTAEEVLDCLASDATTIGESFEDFALNLGYDTDSRKAEKIYKAVLHQTNRLKKFITNSVTFEKLLNLERL